MLKKILADTYIQEEIARYRGYFQAMGRSVQWIGRTVFYPAGGADIVFPFWLNPVAQTVVSVGLQPFGKIPDETYRRFLSPSRELDWHLNPCHYDDIPWYETMEKEFSGIGCQVLAKAEYVLAAQHITITYLDVLEDAIVAVDESAASGKHALLTYTDGTGTIRRFWYFQQDLCAPAPWLSAFMADRHIDCLLIKSALDLFAYPARKDVLYDNTLIFARRDNAAILHDQAFLGLGEILPFWKTQPQAFWLSKNISFGYCFGEYAYPVYYGKGENLLSRDEYVRPRV